MIHVGAGCGYYTALLAELITPSGRVEAYEVEADLADQAQRLLAGYPQVSVHARSALGGALSPADVIYVNAGVSAPPLSLLDTVRPGGPRCSRSPPDWGLE